MRTDLVTSALSGQYTAEPLDHTPHYPRDLASHAVRRVFVHITLSSQVNHTHHFTEIDKQGDGWCKGCGATGWSPGWVKRGVYSGETLSGTADFIAWKITGFCARLEADRHTTQVLAQEILNDLVDVEAATVQVAAIEFDGSEQARRPGIAVPKMPYGVLTVQS